MDDSAKPNAPNSARVLHDILRRVKEANAPTLAQAWSKVLNAEWGTPSFAERHGEVVRLLHETLIQIESLGPDSRERLGDYAAHWWSAVITPDWSWKRTSPSKAVTNDDLNHLADTAEILAIQNSGIVVNPADTRLVNLRAQCLEWISILGEQTEVDYPLRLKLLGQMRYLVRLIDDAGILGTFRVVDHGEQVVGTLILAASRSQVSKWEDFRQRTEKLILALALVTGLVTSAEAVADAANHALVAAEQIVQDISHGPTPVKPSLTEPPAGRDRLAR